MMKLIGEKLRQYDLNRTVELIPKHGLTVETVYFYKNSPEPLVVAHREEDGKIIADIPNIFLKAFGTLSMEVHMIDEEGHLVSKQASFYVSKREMPEGYVYEETPVLKLGSGGGSGGVTSWNDLKDRPFVPARKSAVTEPMTATGVSGKYGLIKIADIVNFDINTVSHATLYGTHSNTYENVPVSFGREYGALDIILNVDADYQYYGLVYAATQEEADAYFEEPGYTPGLYAAVGGGSGEATITCILTYTADVEIIALKALPEGYPYEESGLVEVLPEEAIDISNVYAYPSKDITLEEGETYRIVFDGVEYGSSCKPGTYSGMSILYIGNGGIGGVGENTGEPVAVGVLVGSGTTVVFASESGSHTIGVAKETTVIQPIDPKFLPNPSALSAEWIAAMKTALGI